MAEFSKGFNFDSFDEYVEAALEENERVMKLVLNGLNQAISSRDYQEGVEWSEAS